MLDRPSSLTGQFRDCWRCSSSQNPIRRRPLLPLVSRSPSPSRSPAAVAASVSAFPSRRRLCLRRRGRVHLRGRRVGVSERRRRRRGEQPSPPRSPPSPSAAAARRLLRPPASGSGLHVVGDADLTAVHALGSVSSSAVAEHRHFRLHLALALSSAAAAAPVLRCRCHRRAPLLGPSPPSPTAAAPSSVAAAIEDTTLVTEPASMKAVAAARRGEPYVTRLSSSPQISALCPSARREDPPTMTTPHSSFLLCSATATPPPSSFLSLQPGLLIIWHFTNMGQSSMTN
ncbi:uncharacterized protein LOC127782503 isoform X4 [Oryza glaberrima]|uniref:uncharacterized protein LOC127782503 isoform X4 n=1 Tax=Oryza glaberrima TaxID=4538 RepID=UPI00224C626B|nr:uncharacterized protein LOC127782503 isoform X4 [Oryza glaberrima]XP_052165695.1 uncharacterized protein LOC127782503 isoform X4 [Oryza glaberrima]XP_052165696.1 uncharacterized protein LOC127782503 isoform X4 [Oryza glaberrima]